MSVYFGVGKKLASIFPKPDGFGMRERLGPSNVIRAFGQSNHSRLLECVARSLVGFYFATGRVTQTCRKRKCEILIQIS
jgi:hypothetical protein